MKSWIQNGLDELGNTASNWRSLPISKDLSFPTHSHTLSTSAANVDSNNNMLSYDANPTNQPLDSSTIGRWLQSCSNVEEIRKVHAVVIKCMKDPVVFVNNNLISVYVKFGNLVVARRVFDNMLEKNVVSWTAMLNGYQKHGIGNEALRLFIEFVDSGLHGNSQTYVFLLKLCSRTCDYDLGRQLHGYIVKSQKAYDLDVYVETSLVDMYAKCGQIEDARMLFDRMRRRNAITWNTILAGYARNGLGEEAIRLFRMMKRLKVSVNNLTMVSLLRACGLLRALSTGKEVHAQIFRNFEPNNIFIGSALVWLHCKCGDYASASKVLQSLPDKDVVSWTTMISGYAHVGHEYEALEYLKEMLGEGVEPNPFTYSSALKACAKLENIKQGKLIIPP
ncbi:UNVERIFIED_CONTAM: Pentatricopeptide repeat-containing protein, chloroplastic [Sesamum latifolium]|uniref:Pentatricopeptide repeat-containing protein, chloroplastic n=1 Tax=Sesamum latifolium TaxID=2727402 RepID=A0AAW2VXK5_9LAMI